MPNLLISTAMAVIISFVVYALQQPVSETTGIIAVVATFLLTYLIYYAIRYRLDASSAVATQELP